MGEVVDEVGREVVDEVVDEVGPSGGPRGADTDGAGLLPPHPLVFLYLVTKALGDRLRPGSR